MEYESPDAIKDFPGLYAPDSSKKHESDYSDDEEKVTKKDILIGKRKDKKDKKDKERGYAALEGESSPDENEARSPGKSKKSKSFKFTSSKSKEKRDKCREKDKDFCERKKEKKNEKKSDKDKTKAEKKDKKQKHADEYLDIAEGLPIFGVSLTTAVERSRCHDGVDLPLPVRMCIDYIETQGLTMEGVYKVSGTKSKILQLRKMFNSRDNVNFNEYDVPTITGLLKMFLRDLPEPLFTSDLLVRFEEAGAILNIKTREKHLKLLIENLAKYNQTLLSWLLIHLDNVIMNEKINKMNLQSVVSALSPCLHTSHRLLTALIYHCRTIFPNVILFPYEPPLQSAQLPNTPELMHKELLKQESLLLQIHTEMNAGFISDNRQEMLWEVQRIITQLKRQLKTVQKENVPEKKPKEEKDVTDSMQPLTQPENKSVSQCSLDEVDVLDILENMSDSTVTSKENFCSDDFKPVAAQKEEPPEPIVEPPPQQKQNEINSLDDIISFLQVKMQKLQELKDNLNKNIDVEKSDIIMLKKQVKGKTNNTNIMPVLSETNMINLEKIMELLYKENQILQIKKINLVRQIMEQKEICIDLKAKLELLSS